MALANYAWFRLPVGLRSSIQFPGAAGESFVMDDPGAWIQNDRNLGEFRELMALIGATEEIEDLDALLSESFGQREGRAPRRGTL